MDIRGFRRADGDEVRSLWRASGIKIRPGDDDASLERFAARNEGMFLVALEDGELIGSALAGWDGRRGWLYHVAVHPAARRRGIGRELVSRLEARLRELGCPKVNLIVWADNDEGMRFWESVGYVRETTVEFGKVLM